MLAETKTRRRIRSRPPRRSHANPQSSAHLQLPRSCLAGAADPATRSAYGLPGRGRSPQAQERKSGPQEPAERSWYWPQLREDLGPIGGTQQPEGRRQTRSCPAQLPPPGGPPACPEGEKPPRARRTKAATQEAQDSLGTAPPAPGAWDPLGEYYNHRAADGPRGSSRRCRASDH